MNRYVSSLSLCLVALSCSSGETIVTTRTTRVVPVDTRAPTNNAQTPPIFGGTMAALSSEGVVAADPARDRVTITTRDHKNLELQLEEGALPFRAIETPDQRVHVTLRGTGEVLIMDAETATEVARVETCSAPRGLAYDESKNVVHVACAEGILVSYNAASYEKTAEHELASDLRDIVVEKERLYVSRFRSAEVLIVEQGELIHQSAPPSGIQHSFFANASELRNMVPLVAWRMIPRSGGGVYLLHQRATVDTIPLPLPNSRHVNEDGSTELINITRDNVNRSAYGGSGGEGRRPDCSGIVQNGVTAFLPDGTKASSGSFANSVLPVDIAESPDGDLILAVAGMADPEAPKTEVTVDTHSTGGGDPEPLLPPSVSPPSSSQDGSVGRLQSTAFGPPTSAPEVRFECDALDFDTVSTESPTTAVVFEAGGVLVAQERQPAVLSFSLLTATESENSERGVSAAGSTTGRVALGGIAVRDTGHEVFHRDAGAGISCASCHPEGTTDGHVWNFEELGPRRTQNLGLPLADTAPFHWDGSLPSLKSLMSEIFVDRMGGALQSEERLSSLEGWLFSRKAEKLQIKEPAAVARGKLLFESQDVGCVRCHSGKAYTDNLTHDVGTGAQLQTPPLVGLVFHRPYMHDGCARSLTDRFSAECGGGDQHGKTSHLSQAEVGDLVKYLESL